MKEEVIKGYFERENNSVMKLIGRSFCMQAESVSDFFTTQQLSFIIKMYRNSTSNNSRLHFCIFPLMLYGISQKLFILF